MARVGKWLHAGMTTNGCQVVMDRLKQTNNEIGVGSDMDHYESLRGQGKLEFALQLKVDRGAACMPAAEHHGRDVGYMTQCWKGVDQPLAESYAHSHVGLLAFQDTWLPQLGCPWLQSI